MKTSTKVILVFVICQILILVGSPFGYRSGLFDLMTALGGFAIAFAGGALCLLAIVGLVIAGLVRKQPLDRGALIVVTVLALVPVGFVLPQLQKANSVPPIHDITTNPMDPPVFFEIKKRRVHALNDLVYGDAERSAEDMEALQDEFYPDLETLLTPLTVAESLAQSEAVLRQMGLEIINVDPALGVVEATDTTQWFQFKDDLIVRIRSESGQTLIDLRSVSRVGQSDLGVNAERIRRFVQGFQSPSS